jgi:hypothetical protein
MGDQWMFSVNAEIVERLDRQAKTMSLKRTQLSHTALSLGLMMLEGLDAQQLKDFLDKAPKAQSPSMPKKSEAKPSRARAARPLKPAPAPLSIDALCEPTEAPSSPSEEPSDTVPPSEPIESESSSEDLLEAVMAQVDDDDPSMDSLFNFVGPGK